MTTEILGDSDKQSSLALELTEMGLSLFVCDGDVPVECIAHVALDDPDFSKKLSAFRAAAETSVGKGFETQIWLPDEQVMFRSLKLDEEETNDAREAATSALSASTPFNGDALCFDLGDTNGAGYTPVAAIPKEKMDEAMAFAKKMRMNPRLITTSNVVAGFSSRPKFRAYTPTATHRPAPLRVAALAMMLAAPIFLLSGEIERIPHGQTDAGHAFVASLEMIEAETSLDGAALTAVVDEAPLPNLAMSGNPQGVNIDRSTPMLASADLPVAPVLRPTTTNLAIQKSVPDLRERPNVPVVETSGLQFPDTPSPIVTSRAALLSKPLAGPADAADFGIQFSVSQPNKISAVLNDVLIGEEAGFHSISKDIPTAIFEPGPDNAPSVDMLSVEYVQNVFDDNIEIHDLMAIDDVSSSAFSSPDKNPSLVRLANVGEGVLVRRPKSRSAPRLVQPAFMPRPEKRPLPLLPEQAFDYNLMVPINPASAIEDPPPPVVVGQPDILPTLKRPEWLILRFDEGTKKIIAAVVTQRRNQAILDAQASRGDRLANLIQPKVRDAVPLAGSNGAVAQVKVVGMTPNILAGIAPKSVSRGSNEARIEEPMRVSRLFAQPSLPKGVVVQKGGTAIVRELVPYDPQRAASNDGIRFTETTSRLTLPRPPSRRREVVALTTPVALEPAPVEETQVGTAAIPRAVSPAQLDPEALASMEAAPISEIPPTLLGRSTEQNLESMTSAQAEVAAAALPKFLLPRPPVRPNQATEVAALIQQLDPAPAPTEPVSKYAIDTLFSPAKRPVGLAAQAKKILEQRNSVSHQVAIKQEPVAATPKDRLRIPTGARVGAAATIKDGIALGDISLIGIYGTSKTRRALVRLPQGRYVQISRGDRLSGWTVSAVSEDAVRIQKGSKNKVLRLPN